VEQFGAAEDAVNHLVEVLHNLVVQILDYFECELATDPFLLVHLVSPRELLFNPADVGFQLVVELLDVLDVVVDLQFLLCHQFVYHSPVLGNQVVHVLPLLQLDPLRTVAEVVLFKLLPELLEPFRQDPQDRGVLYADLILADLLFPEKGDALRHLSADEKRGVFLHRSLVLLLLLFLNSLLATLLSVLLPFLFGALMFV
jgi:hypothetical protein